MSKAEGISRTYDVAVVGAGVFGSWIACSLQMAGLKVILVDAYGVANARASSGGETRIMRMAYGSDEIYTRMAERALQIWSTFFETIGRKDLFYRTGSLWLERSEAGALRAAQSATVLEGASIRFERLSASHLSNVYPQICFDSVASALLEPDAGVLMARKALHALVEHHRTEGLHVIAGHASCSKTSEPHLSLSGGSEQIWAGAYVFACGPWLPKLFPEVLGGRIRITRQPVFFFGTPPGSKEYSYHALPALLDLGNLAGVPDIEGRGVKIMSDEHGEQFDPDTDDRVIGSNELSQIRTRLSALFPGLRDAPLLESRVCQYENTSNGDFIIDRHPDWPDVWLVGGGSGHGFKHGPAVGELVTDLIVGSKSIPPRFRLATKPEPHQRAIDGGIRAIHEIARLDAPALIARARWPSITTFGLEHQSVGFPLASSTE